MRFDQDPTFSVPLWNLLHKGIVEFLHAAEDTLSVEYAAALFRDMAPYLCAAAVIEAKLHIHRVEKNER